MLDDQDIRERVAAVERLLDQLESLPDSDARATAVATVQGLLDLYGEALARMVQSVAELDLEPALDAFARDELVSHLLLLHGVHPLDVETRVQHALDEVQPYLASHGGSVELLAVEAGVARLRLNGSCNGCPSSTQTLKLAIEQAVQKAAPELERIEAEGVATVTSVPLIQLDAGPPPAPLSAAWAVAGGLPQLAGGGLLVKEVGGQSILFLKLRDDELLAYQDHCPGCGASFEGGGRREAELTCSGCGHRYDVRRAGRCLDAPQLNLEPVPLLVSDAGIVKVALRSAAG